MSTLEAMVIRLALTTRSTPPITPKDSYTGLIPRFWRGEDVALQLGIFDNWGASVDLSNIAFLNVSLFPKPIPPQDPGTNQAYASFSFLPFPSQAPAPLLSVEIASTDITPLIDVSDWRAGTAQQAIAVLTAEQTRSLNLQGLNSKMFDLVVHGITAGGKHLIFGGGPVEVYETGAQGVYLPNAVAPILIPEETIFLVPENAQIPFALAIEVDGDLDIEGYLIEVDALAAPPASSNMQTPALLQTGELVVGNPGAFGYYVAPAASLVLGIQIAAQTAPVGAGIILELIDGAGVSYGVTANLGDGLTFANVTFITPLALAPGAAVRLRATQVGSTSPGAYITANLIVKTILP